MKRKDIKDLRHKEKEELTKLADQTQEEADKLRLDMRLGNSKNTSLVREKGKDLARILTILSEKEETK